MATSNQPGQAAGKRRFALSEDWLAMLIGLALVLTVGLGTLGPGPQSAKLSAGPGETALVEVKLTGGWKVTATLGGEDVPVTGMVEHPEKNEMVVFTCADGQITVQSGRFPGGISKQDKNSVLFELVNQCDDSVSLSFKTGYAIRWPVFGLFK